MIGKWEVMTLACVFFLSFFFFLPVFSYKWLEIGAWHVSLGLGKTFRYICFEIIVETKD